MAVASLRLARGAAAARAPPPASARPRRAAPRASSEDKGETARSEADKTAAKLAGQFAPRSSTAKGKNPATKGTVLYKIFEVQAALGAVVGGLLSYNVLLPSDEPNIARLMGFWSIWMFTVPSLRARDCSKREKDALNVLFLAIPLLNVTLPLVWKSFAAVYTGDVALMAYFLYSKGVFEEWFGDAVEADEGEKQEQA